MTGCLKNQLLKAKPGLKRLNRGSSPKYPILETALVNWVKENERIKMQFREP